MHVSFAHYDAGSILCLHDVEGSSDERAGWTARAVENDTGAVAMMASVRVSMDSDIR
jgi:hypothetical protein